MRNDFIKTVQNFISVEAIGTSAMRGQITGTMHSAQKYCSQIDLSTYTNLTSVEFITRLDTDTYGMLDAFGYKFRPWGTARKAMNLFLRAALYNKYLSEAYKLERIETFLEIPLDSAVAKGLKAKDINNVLPKWDRLKYLTEQESKIFQQFALTVATVEGLSRVHMDMYLWLGNR